VGIISCKFVFNVRSSSFIYVYNIVTMRLYILTCLIQIIYFGQHGPQKNKKETETDTNTETHSESQADKRTDRQN